MECMWTFLTLYTIDWFIYYTLQWFMQKRSICLSRKVCRFRSFKTTTTIISVCAYAVLYYAFHDNGCLISRYWTDLLGPFGPQILHLCSTWHSWSQKPTAHKRAVSDWQQTAWQPCWCVLWTACWHQRARCSLCSGMHSEVQSPTMRLDTCLSAWQDSEKLRSLHWYVQRNWIDMI